MIKLELIQKLQEAMCAAFPELDPIPELRLDYPENPDHGDYACAIALQLAKPLQKSPREVAERIVENFKKPKWVHAVELAGPGYINVFIAPRALVEMLGAILKNPEQYGRNESGKGQTVMIEYSSPNTNKPLHLGHMRNNVLGMTLANILHANGADVTKTQNYNDRGVHICKSMWAYQQGGRNTSPESLGKKSDHFVGDYYVKYAQAEKENPSVSEEIKKMLKQWEEKDPEVRALWEKMNGWALEGYKETYEKIGSHFDEVTFESDISEGGRAIVEKALKEGKVEKIEGGAIAMDLSDCGLGDSETGRKVLIRSDGTTVYMTQDLQLAVNRMESDRKTDHPIDRLIYVVGNEQDYHFKALFEVLKRLGYDWASNLYHLSYGMVTLPGGKMKSREGTTVDIDNLLEELEGMVEEELKQRDMEYKGEERASLRRAIALGALKYYLLKVDAHSELLYDPAASLDFQGHTGPYLQYTHARLKSILRKAGDPALYEPVSLDTFTPAELSLLRTLHRYPEIMAATAHDYRLHAFANFLYELAQHTNQFYVENPVLEAPTPELRTARLQLMAATAHVLKNGLAILGIEAPERM